ncbi:heavy metal translocating P-type ATPase [Alkalinema pantanalense CENA528]|uniref:heavy metal translocating P-type ATPase n=1 Tax=Alkalinema pantanalense TaxID=1620705 RepID=UPI003D6E4EB7
MVTFASLLARQPTPPRPRDLLTCQLVHAIPGRARFRIPQLARQPQIATQLAQRLKGIAGILAIRINLSARSLIIHYEVHHPIADSLETWLNEQLLHGQTGFQAAISMVPPPPITESAATPTATALAPQFPTHAPPGDTSPWSSLSLPASAALLAVICQLPPLTLLRPLAMTTLLAAALPILQRALQSLFIQQRLNIDCLDVLALSLSSLQGKLLTPALVITLHELGDVIREQTARSTEVRTMNLRDAIGHYAWVKYGDQPPQQVPSDRVQGGDQVVVYPGEQIPVDGTVIQGEAIVDQQSLTGEAMPVVRRVGQSVLASTLVRSGQIYVRADRVGNQTRAAASLALLEKAPVYDTRMSNYAEKVADRLLFPSLGLATLVLLLTRDPARAASILTLDFVTGIRVSIPTAFLSALNHTTRHGVLVRSGRTLEQLAEVDTIVFDKTGTLTQGAISITGVRTVAGGLPADTILQLAAAAEQRLNHPVAEAIVQYAQQRHLKIPLRQEWSYEVGFGVRAQIENRQVLVGSHAFLQRAGVTGNLGLCADPDSHDSAIYIACDQQFQGVIQYTDPLRAESHRLIQTLQQVYQIEVYLLTGDNAQRANQVARELGIPSEQVYAEAFPEHKARVVRNLHRSGRTVAFVGDGLNDSVALAYADVSVSFEHGSEIARETADVVLMNNNLLDLLEAIAISQQTRALIDQNTTLVVAPNLIDLGLATTVGLNPLAATAIHNGSAIAAGLNSLRPLLQHQMEQSSNS